MGLEQQHILMRFLWLLIILLCIAGITVYLNPALKSRLLNNAPELIAPEPVRAYKWRNTRGEWQITDHLPPKGVEYETLEHHRDENILPLPPQLTPKQ